MTTCGSDFTSSGRVGGRASVQRLTVGTAETLDAVVVASAAVSTGKYIARESKQLHKRSTRITSPLDARLSTPASGSCACVHTMHEHNGIQR